MITRLRVVGVVSFAGLLWFLAGCPSLEPAADPCAEVTCNAGFTCDPDTGECVAVAADPCEGVTCEDGETCVDGECVAVDPCEGVTCEEGEACVDGQCAAVDPCEGVTCEEGETCADGQCVATEPPDGGEGAPTLLGLDANKEIVLPFTVQAAYNDDTMFVHMSWEADRGDTHDYFRYTNGAWQRE